MTVNVIYAADQAKVSENSSELIPQPMQPTACGRGFAAIVTHTLNPARTSARLKTTLAPHNIRCSAQKLLVKRFATGSHEAEPQPPDHPRTIQR